MKRTLIIAIALVATTVLATTSDNYVNFVTVKKVLGPTLRQGWTLNKSRSDYSGDANAYWCGPSTSGRENYLRHTPGTTNWYFKCGQYRNYQTITTAEEYPTNLVFNIYYQQEMRTYQITFELTAPKGGPYTNTTSVATVPAWKRTHIMGLPGGELVDPTGTIAPYTRMAAINAANTNLTHISYEAIASISNQLATLYANTNHIADFKRKMFVQANLYPDMTGRDNWWSYVAKSWTDGTNDWAYIYFSRDLSVAPVMKRRYRTETITNIVEGAWVNWQTNNLPMVEGFANCHLIRYERPADCYMTVIFDNPYVFNGTEQNGFDFGSRTFTIDGEYYYTGSWTNAFGKIWAFNNGVKVRGETDVQ